MKTFKTIITALIVFTTMHVVANDGNNAKTAMNAAVQKELRSHLDLKIDRSQKVNVVFTTDVAGKVNQVVAKTDNKELKQAIENKFLQMQFNNLKADVAYGVTLDLLLL